MAIPRQRASTLPRPVALLVYAVLTLVMTWPLAQHASTHLVSADTDVFNVFWSNWWVRRALLTAQNPYWTRYLLYPQGFSLLTFALSPFLCLLWLPFSWIVPPIAAANLLLWIVLLCSCLSMDQLVRYLTNNGWAALVAGITFGFAPSLMSEVRVHLNMAALFWIPLACVWLIRLLREARWRHGLALTLTLGLAFLTRLQVGVAVLLSCGACFAGLAVVEGKTWSKQAIHRLLITMMLSILLLSPLLVAGIQLLRAPQADSLLRYDANDYQADLLAFVLPPPQHPFLGHQTAPIYKQRFAVNLTYWAYVGLLPLGLALYALLIRPRDSLPWAFVGLLFFILALGPHLRINGRVVENIALPYGLTENLWASLGWNWPNRFVAPMMAAVATLVGLACARLSPHSRSPWIVAGIAVLILVDFAAMPWTNAQPPPDSAFYNQLASDPDDFALVDLPLTREAGEVHRYFQTLHRKPIVGGWDHRVLPESFALIDENPLLAAWTQGDGPVEALPTALGDLDAQSVRYIVVHKQQIDSHIERMRTLLLTQKPLFQDPSLFVLQTDVQGTSLQIAQSLSPDLALVEPILYLKLSAKTRTPLPTAIICWWMPGPAPLANGYQVDLIDGQGAAAFTTSRPIPEPVGGLTCDTVTLYTESAFPSDEYRLDISTLAGEQVLGTYASAQPLHVMETRQGTPFSAMGLGTHQAFGSDMELLGVNTIPGEGFLWIDLFWRAAEEHNQTHVLSVQLADPNGTHRLVAEDGIIDKYEWKQGDLFQERRILWLDTVPPGAYRLAVSLDPIPYPDSSNRGPLAAGSVFLNIPLIEIVPGARDSAD